MERFERKAATMCIVRPLTTCAVAAMATLFAGTVAAQAITVTCESINYRDQVCPVPGGPVALVRRSNAVVEWNAIQLIGHCLAGQVQVRNAFCVEFWDRGPATTAKGPERCDVGLSCSPISFASR